MPSKAVLNDYSSNSELLQCFGYVWMEIQRLSAVAYKVFNDLNLNFYEENILSLSKSNLQKR